MFIFTRDVVAHMAYCSLAYMYVRLLVLNVGEHSMSLPFVYTML
jgi:hypothetical protein